MHDLAVVGLGQGLRHSQADAEHLLVARRLGVEPGAQVLPFQVLHDHVGSALVLAHVVDGDDVRVVQVGRGPGLEQEALDRLVGQAVHLADHLDRHPAAQGGVPGQVHLTHAPPGDVADHLELLDAVPGLEQQILAAGRTAGGVGGPDRPVPAQQPLLSKNNLSEITACPRLLYAA